MSNIMIYNIVGTETFAVPETDGAAAAASIALDALLFTDPGVVGLTSGSAAAWVIDSKAGAVEGARTLACLISNFTYLDNPCPSESEIDTLLAAIEVALLTVPPGDIGHISSIGVSEVNLFNAGVPPLA